MTIPRWLVFAAAAAILAWGAYRLWLGTRPPAKTEDARGFAKMKPKTHLVMGVVYILLGAALVATGFGWSPLGDLGGEKPAPVKAVPIAPMPAPVRK